MTDTAEYWADVHRRRINYTEPPRPKRQYSSHECTPKDVPDGTPFKWFCTVCGQKINPGKWRLRQRWKTEKISSL